MIIYEDYNLPCPLLSSGDSTQGASFIRSQFDYGTTQRQMQRGYDTASFSIIVQFYELKRFRAFYEDLNYGTDRFKADFMLHANDNIGKTLRFTAPYSLKALGNNIYQINSSLEIIDEGTAKADNCPLSPYETLTPSTTLTPCGN